MSRFIRSFTVICFVLLPIFVTAETAHSPVPIVSRGSIKLTDDYVQQAFAARKPEAQVAILSNSQRYQKYIENHWVKLNLIEQVNQGAVPDNMPDRNQLMTLIDQTTIARLLIEKFAAEQEPPLEEAAHENYQQNPSSYKIPDRAKAAHILIKTEKRSDAEALALVQKIRAEALSETASFTDLAIKYSEDSSVKTNKGELRVFGRGQMAKPFENAVFSMQKPGEISPVVKTQFGYHIIRLVQKQQNAIKPFSAVKDSLEKKIATQREQDIWKEYELKVAKTNDAIVNKQQVNAWLWFAGMSDFDQSKPQWKETITKLSIAKLLADKATEIKFDQQPIVKQKLLKARRDGLVKLRRRALFDELAKNDYSNSVRETYLANKEQYITPLKADISMIFLARKQHPENEIKSLSESIKKEVENGNIAFSTLALKYSDAPAVQKNKGHMGLKSRGEFGKQLEDAIFSQKKPGVLNPIETADGFFIFKINQVKPQNQLTLDEAKEIIKAKIVNDIASEEYEKLVRSIVNHPDNVLDDAAVDRLYQTLKVTTQ